MKKNAYFFTFFVTFFSMLIILLPNIISNHGLFLFAGDYYYQQIPFYTHAVDVIHKLGFGWDWYTDIGSDFLTSYSYYLTGSIFFWMISWLSKDAVVYVMPIILALKTAIGALGAFTYIRRYVKREDTAFIGAYMYAFSGFQMASLIFNTFHDITALFPFLLLSFDLLVQENRKGYFSFMVAFVALTNYFFFVGVVIFVIMYYTIKCVKKEFKFGISSFMFIVLESMIGTGIASIILFPTFKLLSSADRVNDILYGVDLISYNDNTIIPKILQSMFIIPDPPSEGMLFKSEFNENNWASISFYLPLFTVTGVVSYVIKNKKDWISIILKACLIFALIPVFNSMFSLFNSSYYARWYYMPVLLMCLATAKSLDENYDLIPGIKIAATGVIILSLIACLPDKVIVNDSEKLSVLLNSEREVETELRMFSMSSAPLIFWQCIAFSVFFLLCIYAYEREKVKDSKILRKISVAMIAMVIVTNVIFIKNTVQILGAERNDELNYKLITQGAPEINDSDIFRITIVNGDGSNNLSMIWGEMNSACFHSIESNEIDDFFYNIQGSERQVYGEYEDIDYPIYGLLGVKYILNLSTGDDLNVEFKPVKLEGCTLYDKQGMFYIYKNDYFIPFGSVYDYCIDDETLEKYLAENVDPDNKYQYKKHAMLRALVLDNDDIEQYKDYIVQLPASMLDNLNKNTYFSDCEERKSESCYSFEYNSKGYRAEIKTERKSLVYFSVPSSDGWSVTVNGNESKVIRAHYGLTAVAVESGDNLIEFSYKTPGLIEGKIITSISLSAFLIYSLINMIVKIRSIKSVECQTFRHGN